MENLSYLLIYIFGTTSLMYPIKNMSIHNNNIDLWHINTILVYNGRFAIYTRAHAHALHSSGQTR